MSRSATERPDKCDLAPPVDVITAARSVLGAIDLDPYSTKDILSLIHISEPTRPY